MRTWIVAAAMMMLTAVPAGAMPILLLDDPDGGHLLGADGVDVDGTNYDVRFAGGTCADNFDGCDELSDFVFQDFEAATSASQALLDQVFLDGPDGDFDSMPILNFDGCRSDVCLFSTPFVSFIGDVRNDLTLFFVDMSLAINHDDESLDTVDFLNSFSGDTTLSEEPPTIYWAIWSPSDSDLGQVPEPGTAVLLGMGLLGLAARGKR